MVKKMSGPLRNLVKRVVIKNMHFEHLKIEALTGALKENNKLMTDLRGKLSMLQRNVTNNLRVEDERRSRNRFLPVLNPLKSKTLLPPGNPLVGLTSRGVWKQGSRAG